MSIEDLPKHAANVAVATAPVVSYLSGISAVVTILAGLVSIAWVSAQMWKMFFPDRFAEFIKRINGGGNDNSGQA